MECPSGNPVLGLSKTNSSAADREFSILDWDFTFTAIDEIHLARNKGAKFKSLSYLSMKSAVTCGMSATPLNSRIMVRFYS